MPRKPKQKRSKETVQAIVQAGFIAIARHGRDGATTRHIADIAGVSVGTLYEYFSNKEEVFAAMLESFVQELVGVLEPRIPDLVRMEIKDVIVDLMYQFKELMERDDGLYLKCAPYTVQVDPKVQLKPLETLLMDIFMQYVIHNPENMQIRDLSTMSYIMMNGAVFTIIRYLIKPPSNISFEQLAAGLGNMVAGYVAEERREQAV